MSIPSISSISQTYIPQTIGESPFKNWDPRAEGLTGTQRGNSNALVYPSDLILTRFTTSKNFTKDKNERLENVEATFRPVIAFRMLYSESRAKFHGGGDTTPMIILPAPSNLEYGETGSYDSAGIGTLGALGVQAGKLASGNQSVKSAFKEAKKRGFGALESLTTRGGLTEAVGNLDKLGVGGDAAKGFNIGAQQAFNQYATTEFTGMGTRAYGFTFNLFPKSVEDSNLIRDIAETFQIGAYPSLGDLNMLKYPPKWHIEILDGDGKRNKYVPGIFECYLTDCKVTYNGEANNWYAMDKSLRKHAPFTASITVSFKESRVLTAEDIIKLQQM